MFQFKFGLKGLLLGIVSLACLVAFAGPVKAQVPKDTVEAIKSKGEILIGVRNDFPPIGSVDGRGNPIGFGIDLGNAIADAMGVKAKFVAVTSRTRFPLLKQGSIDIEIGVTTPTVEREQAVDFSIPYIWDAVNMIIKKGASTKLADYAAPKKIATTQGSFVVDVIKQALPNADMVLFQEFPEAVVALQNGRVDAVGINRASAVAFLKRDPDRLAMSEDFFKDPWAIMVRKNDSSMRVTVNTLLQKLWADGSYQKLYMKHFGAAPDFYLWSPYRLQPGIEK
jgi:polar amino acid transport system substrate-binding protein